MLVGTVALGVARLDADLVSVLALPYANLGAALEAGITRATLLEAPVRESIPVSAAELLAPLPRPRCIWATGLAYRDHRAEVKRDLGDSDAFLRPPLFLKAASSVSGPYDPIVLPGLAPDRVDYEGEVAVVIGKRTKNVAPEDAWKHVFGLTAANDVSARDVQLGRFSNDQQNPTLGKSFDTFLPLGPWVATPDEFADPDDVGLRTLVDNEVRQDARTATLIHPVPSLIAFVSQFATLEPGDVLMTGTPAGVGMASGRYLRAGQVVRVELEGVGALENRVFSEPVRGI